VIADEYAWLWPLLRRLARAIRKWETAEEEIDTIRFDLEALLRAFDQASSGERRPAGPDVITAIHQHGQQEEARKRYAATGARELKVISMPGGAYEFIIDGQHRLKLPPRLAALLQVLIQPEGPSTDALVPWKTRWQLRQALATEPGRPITAHALNNLVSRLRMEIRQQSDLHQDFLVVNPAHGLRFAVQKKAFVGGSGCDLL